MRMIKNLFVVATLILMISCGGKDDKNEKKQIKIGVRSEKRVEDKKEEPKESADDMIDMSNKGIGPVSNVDLAETIDKSMATEGEELFKNNCMACHKPTKKFIGPAPQGILDRRSPEWVMNMIMNPTEMTQKDPIAKQMLIDHNGSPMANMGLTKEETRKVLEYFRTL